LISVEKWTTIRNLAREGYGKKAIARMLKISRNTVRKALASNEPPSYDRGMKSKKLLDPYREQIGKMYLKQDLIGTRIYNELISLALSCKINQPDNSKEYDKFQNKTVHWEPVYQIVTIF